MTTINTSINFLPGFDRQKEVKHFDETKQGVKGLVDSGITHVPRIFHHPPENLATDLDPYSSSDLVPMIDLLGTPREELVDKVRDASTKFGFFQVLNHGMTVSLLDRVLEGVKDFHELPAEERMEYYSREVGSGCNYFSNVDLLVSKAASWRDTLQMRLGPTLVNLDVVPSVCRDEVIEWNKGLIQLGELLLGLLSEGLGTSVDRLKGLSFMEGRTMVGHYYPYCPEPEKTMGITSHADPGIFTVLLQSEIGGLQVKHEGKWVDVKPIHGALVVNVGDLLQIVSNEKYRSVDHRVLANPLPDPRVSIAIFFTPSLRENIYGPLPELLSPEEPALYRQFRYLEYITRFFKNELDNKSLTNFFRKQSE